MGILVINCGTASIKTTLFGLNERREQHLKHPTSYREGIEQAIQSLGVHPKQLRGIGHRVVHGGLLFQEPTLITEDVVQQLQQLSKLAPLHNPPSIEGISVARQLFPEVPQVAIFDTAFHSSMEPEASLYPLPLELAERHQIRRYGFHGISHAYVWERYAKDHGPDHRAISLHLGSGCSLTAIDAGRSIDTTMGFTPLEGLMMATRSGSIDPAIVAYLAEQEQQSPAQIIALLNQQSGLLGVSGQSNDMARLLTHTGPRSKLAVDMFIHCALKQLGGLIALLQGVDALLFTGGIGENSPQIRQRLLQPLSWLGLKLDKSLNEHCTAPEHGCATRISQASSKIEVLVVPTDENSAIAQQTTELLGRSKSQPRR
jgi:acetate kinase